MSTVGDKPPVAVWAIEGLIIWLTWAMRRWLAASRTSVSWSVFSDVEESILYVDEAVETTLELAQYEVFVLHLR